MRIGDPDVMDNNRAAADRLSRRMGLKPQPETPFAAGSMFWGRTEAFAPLSDLTDADYRLRAGAGPGRRHDGPRDRAAASFGAVIDQDGRLFRSTVQEALYFTPTLGGLPNVGADEEGARFWPPANPPSTPAGTVFVTWGGLHNYGHFLLDCLPALAASQAAGLLDRFPAIAPALNRWQRQLVNVAFGADLPLTTLDTPIAHVGEVVFSNCMDHFLHSPNAPLDRVREGALSRVADRAGAGKRLYVTRRGDQKRRLVNEGELEAALVARGFQVVQPEELDVFDQVALFRDAEVVVAPTGAALANCLFQGPDTKVFEIMPTNFTGVWVRGVCELFSIRWHGYFCPSPLAEDEVFIEGVRREGVLFNWRIELPDFLTFLDARL
jgi:capsular polysaccharide biosynthesis protein